MPLSTGTNIILRGGQDPDALAYFSRAGIASGTQTPSAYDNAASFNGTNQFLSIPSNSTLTVTGSSFTFAFWANAVNTTLTQLVISKTNAVSDQREFQIQFISGQLRFNVFPDGIFANRSEINIAAGPVNSWNFYVCRYDSAAGTIAISINGGTFSSLGSVPAITQTFSNTLQIANSGAGITGSLYTGQLSSIGFWKRALSPAEVTQLFNSGAGRIYASLDSGLRNNLVSWWALNGTSSAVSLTDSHGVVTGTPNNLTNNGTVTAPNIGPVVTSLTDSRRLISDFVKGIKSLGLWNSMVCWPLRSSQNASTTLTAFSLGGLGSYNGTLTNIPTSAWASDYLSMIGTNRYIVGSFPSISRNLITMSVNQSYIAPNTTIGIDLGCGSPVNSVNYIMNYINPSFLLGTGLRLNDAGSFSAFTDLRAVSAGENSVLFNGYDGSNQIVDYNGTIYSRSITSTVTMGTRFTINNRADNFDQIGSNKYAFAAVFSTSPSTGLYSQIRNLYRQTLGLGLGLP